MAKQARKNSSDERVITNDKFMKSFLNEWIIYVLRTFSSSEKPMTQKQIRDKITGMTVIDPTVLRTIGRKLQDLEAMKNFCDGSGAEAQIGEMFYRAYGGRVIATNERPVRFYFEPILDGADVSVICAALESNHFLSPDEKEYLITRQSVACSYREDEDENMWAQGALTHNGHIRLPKKPFNRKKTNLPPSKDSLTLTNITVLQYAIRKKLKVRVIPGYYYNDRSNIVFGPKRDRESVLNPYAMICQNGQYYLIVTHEGYTNPTHYRIDRLYSAELVSGENGKHEKREAVPTKLERFCNRSGKFVKYDEYTALYPLMAYSGKESVQKCEFLCKAVSTSVVIDRFGASSDVKMNKTSDDEYVKFSVFADYENVKMFCLQQSMLVTPVAPQKLVKDVKDRLRSALDRIDKSVK